MNKKLLTLLSSFAVFGFFFAHPASADTDLSISDNGYHSDNAIYYEKDNDVRVNQVNNTVINNDVRIYNNTGGNSVSGNTGGDVSLRTGDAIANVKITNAAGMNVANISGCNGCGGNTSIDISDNGSHSDNTVVFRQDSTINVNQENNTRIDNNVRIDNNTGNNTVSGNTWGDVDVRTGDAEANVNIENKAGVNIANISGCGENCHDADTDISIHDNGSHSDNTVWIQADKDTNVHQDNNSDFDNDVFVENNTGNNWVGGGKYYHDFEKDYDVYYPKDFEKDYHHDSDKYDKYHSDGGKYKKDYDRHDDKVYVYPVVYKDFLKDEKYHDKDYHKDHDYHSDMKHHDFYTSHKKYHDKDFDKHRAYKHYKDFPKFYVIKYYPVHVVVYKDFDHKDKNYHDFPKYVKHYDKHDYDHNDYHDKKYSPRYVYTKYDNNDCSKDYDYHSCDNRCDETHHYQPVKVVYVPIYFGVKHFDYKDDYKKHASYSPKKHNGGKKYGHNKKHHVPYGLAKKYNHHDYDKKPYFVGYGHKGGDVSIRTGDALSNVKLTNAGSANYFYN